MGKLCEKLGYSHETSLSYYDKAIALNPLAVDPVYRMHASRLKLLYTCGKQNPEVLKVFVLFLLLFFKFLIFILNLIFKSPSCFSLTLFCFPFL